MPLPINFPSRLRTSMLDAPGASRTTQSSAAVAAPTSRRSAGSRMTLPRCRCRVDSHRRPRCAASLALGPPTRALGSLCRTPVPSNRFESRGARPPKEGVPGLGGVALERLRHGSRVFGPVAQNPTLCSACESNALNEAHRRTLITYRGSNSASETPCWAPAKKSVFDGPGVGTSCNSARDPAPTARESKAQRSQQWR